MVSLFGIFFVMSSLFFGSGFLAAIVARNKGYRPWFWILSAGPFGLLLILLKPSLRSAKTPEERERWEQRIDLAGGILSGFTLFFMFAVVPLVATVGLYSVRVAAPAPVMMPVPVISVKEVAEPATPAESSVDQGAVSNDRKDVEPTENAEGTSGR